MTPMTDAEIMGRFYDEEIAPGMRAGGMDVAALARDRAWCIRCATVHPELLTELRSIYEPAPKRLTAIEARKLFGDDRQDYMPWTWHVARQWRALWPSYAITLGILAALYLAWWLAS